MRRPIPFRIRVALAGLAGLGLAWLIPKGGGEAPAPMPTPIVSNPSGVTAVTVPLDLIPQGVSFHPAGEVRVFVVRTGSTLTGFHGVSTAAGDGPVFWCQRNVSFESADGAVRYDRDGRGLLATAPRDLDRVRVLVTADRVTIFPRDVTPGAPASQENVRFPAPCSPSERLG
jgi:hypothetical protein